MEVEADGRPGVRPRGRDAGIGALSARDAFRRQKLTLSRELTNLALLEVDPARSAHLGLAAMDTDPNNVRADYAVRQALATLEIAHTEKIIPLNGRVVDVRYTRDGSRLVTASGTSVNIFDARTFEPVGKPIGRDQSLVNAWLIANSTTLVTWTVDVSDNSSAQIQRLGESTVRQVSCGQGNSGYPVAVSPDERLVALGCFDGSMRVWDMANPTGPEMKFGNQGGNMITALAFSADGEYLASGDFDGIVTIWKPGRQDAWIGKGAKDSPIKHARAVRDIGFHPEDPELLVTAADDKEAIVWQLDLKGRRLVTKGRSKWVLSHDRPVVRSKFVPRPDDRSLLLTVSDKTARLWRNESQGRKGGARARRLGERRERLKRRRAARDGEQHDGTARVWSTRSELPSPCSVAIATT